MRFTLRVWRQNNAGEPGRMVDYDVPDVSSDSSFLEMMDLLNERLEDQGQDPIAFDYDCREGICGTCALVINGRPHGPRRATTTCQVYMRDFADGQIITVEPFRAQAFPLIRDLVVDRKPLDTMMQAGGFVSVNTGSAPDANAIPIAKEAADDAFAAATCVGCGACVAACPNSSAMLFVAAKASQFALLPQGQPERLDRAVRLVDEMDRSGFGGCSNHYECEAACPEAISIKRIGQLNRDYMRGRLLGKGS